MNLIKNIFIWLDIMPRYKGYSRTRKPYMRRKSTTDRRFKAKVKRIISQQDESKFIDTELIGDVAPIAGTSVITPLCLVATGTTDEDRIGDTIKLTSIEMKYFVRTDATSADLDSLTRIIIFRAKVNIQGVQPVVTAILSNDRVTSLRQTNGGSDMTDFKVYLDKSVALHRNYLTNQAAYMGKFYKSLGGLKCTYNGSAGTIATVEEGQLFLLRVTDQATGNQPRWTIDIRVRFKEM